jgi:hypothetical protein
MQLVSIDVIDVSDWNDGDRFGSVLSHISKARCGAPNFEWTAKPRVWDQSVSGRL